MEYSLVPSMFQRPTSSVWILQTWAERFFFTSESYERRTRQNRHLSPAEERGLVSEEDEAGAGLGGQCSLHHCRSLPLRLDGAIQYTLLYCRLKWLVLNLSPWLRWTGFIAVMSLLSRKHISLQLTNVKGCSSWEYLAPIHSQNSCKRKDLILRKLGSQVALWKLLRPIEKLW